MTDMLQKGQEWLASKLPACVSPSCISPWRARSHPSSNHRQVDVRPDDGEGIVTRSQVRDFLIDTYSLLSSIIGTLPRRGDTIVEIDGDHTFIILK